MELNGLFNAIYDPATNTLRLDSIPGPSTDTSGRDANKVGDALSGTNKLRTVNA